MTDLIYVRCFVLPQIEARWLEDCVSVWVWGYAWGSVFNYGVAGLSGLFIVYDLYAVRGRGQMVNFGLWLLFLVYTIVTFRYNRWSF